MEARAGTLRCYSSLSNILSERRMSVASLDRALARRNVRVNIKTLYRLTDPTAPIERLDMGVAGEICKVLGVDLSHLVSFEAVRRDAGLRRLPTAGQRRLDLLLEQQAEGNLSARGRRELAELVERAERLTVQNARTLARARQTAGRM